ncbi:nickel pincer cofactor biosynthesis protein LarC [Candidatus Aminicenantes bacterium AC-708-M15]|jgi:hypothetical protein|nr:nickel pincer cofactor biosynthesis protein LarC [SCandidatus Aminicenantes bacterium Aminicenantia_JdfR_composite]MCP2596952.1 nickel pincer cofactor biosynthesis protein LarC [Candidatus Aminicenantes bacterium AC-335-G13]MCP2603970.1 nickel pincer cofactor biosynthesis protein LarC [Candidatus Aminicenantes bacterium AC-708-M15]
MKFVYFDCMAGISGDMVLGALIDLGISATEFKNNMERLHLPVDIEILEVRRASLRGTKVNVLVKEGSSPRKFSDIKEIIEKTDFSNWVKEKSLEIFERLFKAESKVHGVRFDEAHLHEAGADDALIDVVGACFLLEKLNIKKIYSSPLNLGNGWINTEHGVLPVPPPAVAEILKNIPVYSAHVKGELVTPTGASIIATLCSKFSDFPEIEYEKIGYGAGSKDFPDFPNILRAFYGEINKEKIGEKERIYVIETNIDDINPQFLGAFFTKALSLGALDVFLTPVVMKKNRLGNKLTILTKPDKINSLLESLFKETTSIGVRYFPVERIVLKREIKKVKVFNQEVGIKISYLKEDEINIQPEFSDCEKVAEMTGKSIKEIYQIAITEYLKSKK